MSTRIKTLREARGYDQAELARLADMYPSNLCQLEKGRGKAGPRVRARVAGALEVVGEQLFDEQGWPLAVEAARV